MTLPGFMLCETCGGAGILEPPISGNDPHGAFANVPCPDCNGTGQVPDPAVVQAVAWAMYSDDSKPWMAELARGKARLGLLAYARYVKENA